MTKLNQSNAKLSLIHGKLNDCENELNSLNSKEVPELFVLQENKAVMEAQHQVSFECLRLRFFCSDKLNNAMKVERVSCEIKQ